MPSVGTAADAVATGFALGAPERVREPAEYLLADAQRVGRAAAALARRVLGLPEPDAEQTDAVRPTINHRAAVSLIRARLIRSPRDPLAYVDLARRYAALGQIEQAFSAFRAALALAPGSRFVLRSASRFYVHAGDPERAHDLLRRSPRTREDPWLLAAEISAATVAARTSRLVRRGRELVARAKHASLDLTELAGALATVELNDGNNRVARKLFGFAMGAPTDNSLAQAQWAAPMLGLSELPEADSVPRAYEAAALTALREGKWPRALDACFQWLDDEPFSHKSAALGSFVASTGLGDHRQAVLLADEGLTANPEDQTLRNNLVYALASDGQLDRAVAEAENIDIKLMDADTLIAWTATIGLLNYRLGLHAVGREHYEAALAAAERQGKAIMATVAALNWGIAAVTAGAPDAAAVVQHAVERAGEMSDPPTVSLRDRLQRLARLRNQDG